MSCKPTILLFTLLLLLVCSCGNKNTPDQNIENGFLNCTNYNFEELPPLSLSGDWDFYWNELLSPQQIASGTYTSSSASIPSKKWSESNPDYPLYGYGTYQLKIKLPENHPPLALENLYFGSAVRIYINDELWLDRGKVGKSPSTTEWSLMNVHESLPNLEGKTDLVITIQVANFKFRDSGIIHQIYLGTAASIIPKIRRSYIYNAFTFGGAFFFGLFLIFAYFSGRFQKHLLYLGIVIICFCYRAFSNVRSLHYSFPNIDWDFAMRLEYTSTVILVYSLVAFYAAVYPKENYPSINKIFFTIEPIFVVLFWICPIAFVFKLIYWHLVILVIAVSYLCIFVMRIAFSNHKDRIYASLTIIPGVGHLLIYFFRDSHIFLTTELFTLILNILMFSTLMSIIAYRQFSNYIILLRESQMSEHVKSSFLSLISHEMRTPMNGVLGMADLLKKTKLDDEQQEYVSSIQYSGDHLIKTIDQIFDVIRIREGKFKLAEEEVDIKESLESVITYLSPITQSKKLDLIVNVMPSVPNTVISDAAKIKQLFYNLISNAIKFTDEGQVKVQLYAEEKPNHMLMLCGTVSDTGIGIAKELQQKIFDLFLQLDEKYNRRYEGTGLGLVICKHVVEAIGGSLEVESKLNEGTKFHFTLPLKKAIPSQEEIVIAPRIATNETRFKTEQLSVLVVEDNVINSRLLLMGLKKLGIVADNASNGKQAVQACQLKHYDLIFMDIQMPEMDGIEASKQIRQLESERSYYSYIAALTANTFIKEEVLVAGMSTYLTKPIQIDTIKVLLKEVTDMVNERKQETIDS